MTNDNASQEEYDEQVIDLTLQENDEEGTIEETEQPERHYTRSSKRKIKMEPSLHGTLGAYWLGQPTKYAGVPYQKRTSNVIHSVDTSQKNLAMTTASSQQQQQQQQQRQYQEKEQQEQKELSHVSPQNDQGSLSKTPDSSPRRSMQTEDDSYTAAQKAIWEENFQRLVAFKKRHKTTRVPRSYKPLGNWVRYQQRCYKGGNKKRLSKYRIRRLNSIDFAWEANTALSVTLTAIQTKEKQEFPQEMETSTMTAIAHNLLLAPTLNRQREKKLEREGKINYAISNDDWRNNKEKPRMAGMPRPLQIQLKNCPPIRVVWDYGELRLGRLLHPKFKRTDSKIDDDQPQYGMPRIVWRHGPDRPDPQLEANLNNINSTSNNGQLQDEQSLRVVWNHGRDCLGQQLQFVWNFEAQNRRLPSADGSQDESLVEQNHNRNEDYGHQPKTNAAGHALTLEEQFANIVHTTATGTAEDVPNSGTENGEATGVSNETAIFVTDEESSNETETENPATIPKIANHQATDIQLQEQIVKNPKEYYHQKFEKIDLICFRSSMHSEDEAGKIVIPQSLLQDVIRWYHRTKRYSDHKLLYEDISTKFYAPLLYQKCYEILSIESVPIRSEAANNRDALKTAPRVYEPVDGTQSMDLLESLSIGSDATFNLLESSTHGSIQDMLEDLTGTCNMDLSLLKTMEERRILEDYLFNRGICDLTELTMKGLEGCSGRVLEAFLRSMNVQTGIMGRRLRKDELMLWVYNRVWQLEKHELIEWYHNRTWEGKTQDHLLESLSIGSDATFETFDLLENGEGSLTGCNNPTGGTCNMDFSLLQSTEQRKRLIGFLKEKGLQDLTELTMQELEDCPKIVMMAFLRSLNVKVYVKRALKHVVLNKEEMMECIQNRVWENEANEATFGTFNPLESGTQGIHLDQVSLTDSYTHVNNQSQENLSSRDKAVGEIGRDQPIRDTRDMDMSLLKTTEERKLLGDYLEEKGVHDLTKLTVQELEECPKVVVMAFLRSMNIQVYINQQLLSKDELIELVQNKVWEEGANMCWI